MNLTTVGNFGPTWPVGCKLNGPQIKKAVFTFHTLSSEIGIKALSCCHNQRSFHFRFPVLAHNSATMTNPSSVGVRKPITHVVFDMDGLLLGISFSNYIFFFLHGLSVRPFLLFITNFMILLQTLRSSILKFKKLYLLDTIKLLNGLSRQR
jgi:hypothetical protein